MKSFPTLEPSVTSLLNHSLQHGLRPGRRSALAMVLLGIFAAAIGTDAQPTKSSPAATIPTNAMIDLPNEEAASGPRPDLLGQVHAKGGAPLPASVFIATAAPKTGTSTFCPSCYADCIKHTAADIAGRFKIESLDPQLTFQVLAVAKGFKPKYVSKVDPAKGPIAIELEAIEAGDATPNRSLRGRVVNPKGEPISGAVVEMQGIETKDGGGSWGSLPGIDPLAVTDENGEFLITAKKPF
ncbi:MAG: carboxypeptidase-like regulatory domain-containing protein, partial [Verrucomicrobiota bacterium]